MTGNSQGARSVAPTHEPTPRSPIGHQAVRFDG